APRPPHPPLFPYTTLFRSHLIALRTPLSVVVLNRFPYNNGHLLIAPRAHKGQPHELTPEEASDVHQTICRCIAALDELMQPHGRSEEHTSELQSPDHLVCR